MFIVEMGSIREKMHNIGLPFTLDGTLSIMPYQHTTHYNHYSIHSGLVKTFTIALTCSSTARYQTLLLNHQISPNCLPLCFFPSKWFLDTLIIGLGLRNGWAISWLFPLGDTKFRFFNIFVLEISWWKNRISYLSSELGWSWNVLLCKPTQSSDCLWKFGLPF